MCSPLIDPAYAQALRQTSAQAMGAAPPVEPVNPIREQQLLARAQAGGPAMAQVKDWYAQELANRRSPQR